MSGLVEKVAQAIDAQLKMDRSDLDARAAIKAVAEWVREAGGDDMYARAFSKMISDELKEGSE